MSKSYIMGSFRKLLSKRRTFFRKLHHRFRRSPSLFKARAECTSVYFALSIDLMRFFHDLTLVVFLCCHCTVVLF
nr:MAG TPA: hypothetical protein [Caudoviricetes sp.]